MAAANTDKLRKLSRKWVGQIGAAGVTDDTATTIPLSSTTNLATDTAVTLVIDRVDSAGTKTPTLEETIVGVVSGNNIVNALRGIEGTAQAHSAGAVVEVLVTADGYNDIIDHLLVGHLQSGAHAPSSISASMIAASAVSEGNLNFPITSTNLTPAPGTDLTSTGIKVALTANENQAFGDVCYIDADGEAHLGDADAVATSKIVAMCADATIAANASGNYLLLGVARQDAWNWTPGGLVYLTVTATTGNTLSQTAPTGTDDCVVVIGIATHADRLFFNPSLDIIERT